MQMVSVILMSGKLSLSHDMIYTAIAKNYRIALLNKSLKLLKIYCICSFESKAYTFDTFVGKSVVYVSPCPSRCRTNCAQIIFFQTVFCMFTSEIESEPQTTY